MLYGYINSLILIVDTVSVSNLEANIGEYSDDRVKSHIDHWSESAIDAVFGLLTRESLKFVCLFINKIDILRASGMQFCEGDVLNWFDSIKTCLQQRCPEDTEFHVIVGSAKTGENMNQMRKLLIESGVSAEDV